MPRKVEFLVYNINELKESFPDVYDNLLKNPPSFIRHNAKECKKDEIDEIEYLLRKMGFDNVEIEKLETKKERYIFTCSDFDLNDFLTFLENYNSKDNSYSEIKELFGSEIEKIKEEVTDDKIKELRRLIDEGIIEYSSVMHYSSNDSSSLKIDDFHPTKTEDTLIFDFCETMNVFIDLLCDSINARISSTFKEKMTAENIHKQLLDDEVEFKADGTPYFG